MTIAITCSCSAWLEVDPRFAGQTITCPDCQKKLEVPKPASSFQRTSGYALLSIVLALVGAFTVVGTLLAVVFGILAIIAIRRDPKRLAGVNFAITGIALGILLTGVSLFGFISTEFFGLEGLIRQPPWIGKLFYPEEMEVQRKDAGYKIKRPSEQWGVFIQKYFSSKSQYSHDLLLVNPAKAAYLICLVEDVDVDLSFDRCQERALQVFRQLEITQSQLQLNPHLNTELKTGNKRLWNKEENGQKTRFMETTVNKTYHGQTKTFLLRVIKKDEQLRLGTAKIYIVAAGTWASHFPPAKELKKSEFYQAVDSFQIVD